MTAFAVATEGTLVNIQLLMTGCAGARQFDFFLHRGLMTCQALETEMGSFQLETVFSVVLKLPEVPAIRGVTGFAVPSEFLFMLVIPSVAVVTPLADLPEFRVEMTTFARRYGM